MSQIKRPRLWLILLAPLLGGRTRCVVSLMTSWKSSSSRTSMPVDEAILAPSGEVTSGRWDGKRDRGAIPAHSKHDWHLFCVISWRGKCRSTYLPSRVWSTGCFCIMNPLNIERLWKLFHGACGGVWSWCKPTDMASLDRTRTLEHYGGTCTYDWGRHYCAYGPLPDVPVE